MLWGPLAQRLGTLLEVIIKIRFKQLGHEYKYRIVKLPDWHLCLLLRSTYIYIYTIFKIYVGTGYCYSYFSNRSFTLRTITLFLKKDVRLTH